VLIGTATAVLGVAAALESVSSVDGPLPPALGALLAAAMVAPLAVVRLWPVAGAILSTVVCLSGLAAATPVPIAAMVALAFLFATVGHERSLPPTLLLLLPFAGYAIVPTSADGARGRVTALGLLTLLAVAATVGAALRLRTETRRRLASEQSAAASMLEYAARGERARIARELHDVVAHHITMIALQADATRLATPGLPPDGARRLTAIGDTARTALTEMRRLLGVLRADVDAEDELRRPQPGLSQLYPLLDEVREAGSVGVRLIVSGPVEHLDPGLELTAYRIVQEALTNVRRHAPGASVDVELRYGDDELCVRVHDNGPGPPLSHDAAGHPEPGGHGLAGMRERAARAGGHVTVGPGPTSGFLVDLVLPTKGAAP
jgi:signal transduction histidine kinase